MSLTSERRRWSITDCEWFSGSQGCRPEPLRTDLRLLSKCEQRLPRVDRLVWPVLLPI